ncbi:MAG: SEFIR domain-containing protein [Nannocystaceae bacterium]
MVRVFITYSHDSDAHRARVLGLADRMRRDGLDVRLDQYEVHVPEGWLMWMRRQLESADFVAMICTATYHRRFEGEESASDAHAATWEGALTQQILYDAGSLNHRFIPLLFEGDTPEQIPLVLRAATRYVLPAGYEDLYRHLTDQPKTPPPPIGALRRMPPAPRPGADATHSSPAPAPPRDREAVTHDVHDLEQGSAAPATILLVTANAAEPGARLYLEEESRAIQEAVRRARHRERYELRLAPALSLDGLIHELDDGPPSFVHFAAHGDHTGALLLKSDDAAGERRVSPESLCRLFSILQRRPLLVVFASCRSRALAQLIAPYVGFAIGFRDALSDEASRRFSALLYGRLAAHDPPDIPRAFAFAQLAALSAGFSEIEGACLFDREEARDAAAAVRPLATRRRD